MFQCPLSGYMCFNHKNIAVYSNINGQLVLSNVCSYCANQSVYSNDAIWQQFIQNIFKLLHIDKVLSPHEYEQALLTIKTKDQLNEFLNTINKQENNNESSPCPNCGIELGQILANTRMGCAKCYDHFKDIISSVIRKVQNGDIKHVGKTPKNREIDVSSLEGEMKLAIQEERYEDAAKIRDKINAQKSAAIPPTSQAE
jgi:protein-arginine kinase activator protein McsA